VNALGARIARLIERQGPLSIAQFMTLALHDPRAGYYATRDPFGRTGDFITAPEVSQMFGELLGLWIVETWRRQGAPAPARLVELGPGRGTLMADALRAARAAPDFLSAIDVVLIESSPALRGAQREILKDAGVAIDWRSGLGDDVTDRPPFVLANEFFDALPIRQYVKTERGWCERMVTATDGALAFALAPVPVAGLAVPEARATAEPGAVYEISPSGTAMAEEIAQAIALHGGAALIVDYGHDGTGFGDTLQAVTAHKFTEVLAAPGAADLSAHVDFAALAAASRHGGAKTYGPVAQGTLLDRLGLKERAAQLRRANPKDADAIDAAVARLSGAREMGMLFRTLAILPERAPPPPGF
jgi:SAM-dependent MidA family methyltransferase